MGKTFFYLGEDKSNEINGFNFKILNEKHPKDQEKLSEFKQFLLDENNPMAPMKVWQMQDLSLQTAARVLNRYRNVKRK